MSLIGPRPEREVFYHEFEKYIHGFSERMYAKPGVTGLAQVNGGYDLLPEEKVLYDFWNCAPCSRTNHPLFSWRRRSVRRGSGAYGKVDVLEAMADVRLDHRPLVVDAEGVP